MNPATSLPLLSSQSDPKQASRFPSAVTPPTSRSPEEDMTLRKVARDFESIFLSYMMKTMRATVPDSGLTDAGMDKEFFTGLFDEEVSKLASNGRGTGLADMIYRQLSRREGSLPDLSPLRAAPQLPAVRPSPSIGVLRRVEQFGSIIDLAARQFNIEPNLIRSVIVQESSGRPDAVSPKGAKGLMQLMDGTAQAMGVRDVYNPRQNIFGGTRYLRQLLDRYNGDLSLALASYNAGPGTVDRYGEVPPFDETRQYVARVLQAYKTHYQQAESD